MPSADQFRSARLLLGLTQYQVANRMGIDESSIGTMESINGTLKPLRPRVIFYDCWLREFARLNRPELLGAVDAILDCISIASYLRMPEPRKSRTKKQPCLLVEEDLAFASIQQMAKYIHRRFPDYSPDGIGAALGRVLRNEADQWHGLHFKRITLEQLKEYEDNERLYCGR